MKLRQLFKFMENIRVLERNYNHLNYIYNLKDLNLQLKVVKEDNVELVPGTSLKIDFENDSFNEFIDQYLDMNVSNISGIKDIGGCSWFDQNLVITVRNDVVAGDVITVSELFNLMRDFKITYYRGVSQRTHNSVKHNGIGEACLSHNIAVEFYIKDQKEIRIEKFNYYSLKPFLENKEYQKRLESVRDCIVEELFELELYVYNSSPTLKLLVENK